MRILVVLFCWIAVGLNAQVVWDKTEYDFGDLDAYSDRFFDLTLRSESSQKHYVLRIQKTEGITTLVKGNFIDKDSTVTIRIQINPKQKGAFQKELPIYTSDRSEPTSVKIKGNFIDLPQSANALTDCPSFDKRPTGSALNVDLQLVILDETTQRPIPQAQVYVLQNGRTVTAQKTNKSGRVSKEIPLGFAYFRVQSEGYETAEEADYLNFSNQKRIIYLRPKSDDTALEIVERVEEVVEEMELLGEDEPKENRVEVEAQQQAEDVSIRSESILYDEAEYFKPEQLEKLDRENFEPQYFKPINVTFVLDISSSMRSADKMELMKYCLNALNERLRAEDRISVVTYADHAKVLVYPISGSDKNIIPEKVAPLKASGLTAGGEGIKLGYQQNLDGFLEEGVNHVIVITDGAFNRNSEDYQKHVRRYKKKGITLSIVGIKNKENDAKEMQESAAYGGGNYIPIMKLADAENNVFQELRILSYRY